MHIMTMSVKASSRAVHLCILWLLISTVLLQLTDGFVWKKPKYPKPHWKKVLYFHDILYNGKNAKNATSTIVAAPQGANLTSLTDDNHFGDLAVFDDPITLDNNMHSPPVGRAQGFYLYDMKNTFSAWLGFTFVLNSTDHRGTITFAGADPILTKYRDISVVGGTGDFLMARGIATISTDAYEGDVYFRLRVNITLYECYHCLYSLSATDDSA
uniref:Dirigent protein n=1 Tax=Picea sitchensis TaxID=3332 RepID=C0PRJ9_PICSI|nr:unknown [Picea sitchensis]